MIRAALIWLMLLPAGAAAQQPLPALHDVTGIARADTLNVRAGPSTEFGVVGKLAPDAAGIEVVDVDPSGDWGLVNIGEGAGWVAMRYLVRQPGQPADGPPNDLICAATEPFWSFRLIPDGTATLSRAGGEVAFSGRLAVTSENRPDRHALFADGGETVITAILGRAPCSDGMTSRAYGLGIDLLVTDTADVRLYSGCCRIAR